MILWLVALPGWCSEILTEAITTWLRENSNQTVDRRTPRSSPRAGVSECFRRSSSRFFFSFGWEDAMQWSAVGRGLRDCAAVLGANFFLVAGCVKKVVGAGCCSAARGGAGCGEQRLTPSPPAR